MRSVATSNRPSGRRAASTDRAVRRALAHPLRWQILALLNEGTNSPAGLARRMGVRTENVSYHVRVLHDLGVIELVGTTPVRGALEHHYRARQRAFLSDVDTASLPPHVRRDLGQGIVRDVIADLVRGAADGATYERADTHLSRTPLHLDEQGWQEVNDVLAECLDRVMEIQAESLARIGADPQGPAVASELVLLHFPRAPRER